MRSNKTKLLTALLNGFLGLSLFFSSGLASSSPQPKVNQVEIVVPKNASKKLIAFSYGFGERSIVIHQVSLRSLLNQSLNFSDRCELNLKICEHNQTHSSEIITMLRFHSSVFPAEPSIS